MRVEQINFTFVTIRILHMLINELFAVERHVHVESLVRVRRFVFNKVPEFDGGSSIGEVALLEV